MAPFRNYNRIVKENGLYRCKQCPFKNGMHNRDEKSRRRLYNLFLDTCHQHCCIPLTTFDEFDGCETNVKYICPRHGETSSCMKRVVQGAWCYQCGVESRTGKMKHGYDDVKRIVESKNNNILLNKEEYINSSTNNLLVKCGSCGNIFKTSLASIQASNGMCLQCGHIATQYALKIKKEDMISLSTINGKLMVVDPDSYISMNDNMLFYCSECGEEFETTPRNYIKRGFTRCAKCWSKKSKGEYKIQYFLDNNNINYVSEKRYDDCRDIKPLPFDFYLPDYNTIIEYDGIQHFEPIDVYGGDTSLEILCKHDKIKDEYCHNNNINLLRIPYWEYDNIEGIITKELKLSDNN